MNERVSGLKLAWLDIQQMWSSHVMLKSVLGLMVLPLLYSFIYLWAFWNPAERVNKLPLAIVNEDKGEYRNGEHESLGAALVTKLTSDKKANWITTTAAKAHQGVENNTYVMAMFIPEYFTEQAYSVGTDTPEYTHLRYEINEGANMLSAKVVRAVADTVEEQLRQQLTGNYLKVIFDQILNGANGLKEAADGAAKLAAATKQASVGAGQLSDGLRQSGEGMQKLEEGITPLTAGANELENGLARLGAISEQFNKKMDDWMNRRTSIGTQLSDVDKQLEDVQNGLLTTMGQVGSNVQQMNSSLKAVNDSAAALKQVSDAADSVQNKLNAIKSNMDEGKANLLELGQQFADLSSDERFKRSVQRFDEANGAGVEAEQALSVMRQSIESLSASLQQAASNLTTNASVMVRTLDRLSSDLEKFRAAEKTASDWLDQQKLLVDSLSERISEVAGGVKKLRDGSGKLVNGMLQLHGGVEALRIGNTKLEAGASSLRDGLRQIHSGQAELASKLSDAAAIATKDEHAAKRQEIIQNPVDMEESNLHPVPSNGVGFAPYFIALSLWVGSLVLFFVIDITQVRAHPKGPLSYLINKYLALCSVSVCQAVLSVFVLHASLGIPTVVSPMSMYAFAILIGLVFTAILFMLISILGSDVGRFVAVLILMLQLTSSSGSYPVELEPDLFKFIQPYLPMTYAVLGLRRLISIGGVQQIIRTALVLSGFGLGSLLLLYLVKRHKVLGEIEHAGS